MSIGQNFMLLIFAIWTIIIFSSFPVRDEFGRIAPVGSIFLSMFATAVTIWLYWIPALILLLMGLEQKKHIMIVGAVIIAIFGGMAKHEINKKHEMNNPEPSVSTTVVTESSSPSFKANDQDPTTPAALDGMAKHEMNNPEPSVSTTVVTESSSPSFNANDQDPTTPAAYAKMAATYYQGIGTNVDYNKAYEFASKASLEGDGHGDYWLGKCYEEGNGVDKNVRKAFLLYKKASDVGVFDATEKVAQMCIDGQGTDKGGVDGIEAIKYLKRLDAFVVEPTDPEALISDKTKRIAAARFTLGHLYDEGKIVPKNLTAARSWYEKSVADSNVEAMVALGDLYYYGRGVSKNIQEAFDLYKRASDLGSGEAERNIGFAYYKGEGVPKDFHQAFRWYTRSAEHGHPDGTYQLGVCYEYGRGVTKDKYEAYSYYKKAAELGSVGGKQALEMIAREKEKGTY